MHTDKAKGSTQSRIDPFTLFANKTADNCNNCIFSLFVCVVDNYCKSKNARNGGSIFEAFLAEFVETGDENCSTVLV